MRILRIIPSINPAAGGPVEGIRQISSVLARDGHVIEIASVDPPAAPWVIDSPFKTYALGPAKSGYAYSAHLLPWLRENATSYDSVIVHGLWQYPSFATWQALRKSRTPYFVYTHGMLDPWFKETYPLKHLKKSLYWPWAEYRVLRDAKGVFFTCEEERLSARRSFRHYKCNEIVVNYGTVKPTGDSNEQREIFLNRFSELREKRLFLFLSRIHIKKGCDLLIDAFSKVAENDKSLHLVMAGPDQTGLQAQLEEQAKRLGIADRITWAGMLQNDIKLGAFYAAEAFVLPSHQENFGIAVAEALACGVPVLISNKVNIWREIEAAGAAFVEDDTADGTARLLQKWLLLTEEEKQRMRVKAQECFMEHFEIHKAAQSLIDALAPTAKS